MTLTSFKSSIQFLLTYLCLSILLTLGWPLLASAQEKVECIEVKAYAEFSQDFAIHVDPTLKYTPCDSSSLLSQLLQALIVLKSMPQDLGTGIYETNPIGDPFEYFKKRIKEIVISKECPLGTAMLISHDSPNRMTVCPGASGGRALYLSSLLLHEARHLDGHQFDHQTCATPDVIATGNCDHSIEDKGSYGVQVDYLIRISNSKGLPQATREQAREIAIYLLPSFNVLPFGLRKGFLVQLSNGDVRFSDLNKTVLLRHGDPGDFIFNQNSLTQFMTFQKTEQKVGLYSHRSQLTNHNMYTKNFKLMVEICSSALIDFFRAYDYQCFLFSDLLNCNSASESIAIVLKTHQPVGFLITKDSKVLPANSLFIRTSNRKILQLPHSLIEMKGMTEKTMAVLPNTDNLVGLVTDEQGNEIGITSSNQSINFSEGGKKLPISLPMIPRRAKIKKILPRTYLVGKVTKSLGNLILFFFSTRRRNLTNSMPMRR